MNNGKIKKVNGEFVCGNECGALFSDYAGNHYLNSEGYRICFECVQKESPYVNYKPVEDRRAMFKKGKRTVVA